jgi:hypothetical protein
MNPNYNVRTLDSLTSAERVLALRIPDLLERPMSAKFRDDYPFAQTLVLYEVDDAVPRGRITLYPHRLAPFREIDTGRERFADVALLCFPTTPTEDRQLWDELFDRAEAIAASFSPAAVAVYLPSDCVHQADYLVSRGFARHGDADSSTALEMTELPVPSVLYRRADVASHDTRRLYPLSETRLMRFANTSTALKPEPDAWHAVSNYAGFTGYAWLSNMLDDLLPSCSRLLSAPCGTGDVIRMLPRRILSGLQYCAGVDVLPRNVRFARGRLSDPYVDLLNIFLCSTLLDAARAGSGESALSALHDLAETLGHPLSDEAANSLYVQLRAVALESFGCGGIADWFAALKMIAIAFLQPPPEQDPLDAALECVALLGHARIDELFSRHPRFCPPQLQLASSLSELQKAGAFDVFQADMFVYDAADPFDAVFVWEAMAMISSVGRQGDFTKMLARNTTDGATVVMTGMRRDDGLPGRDLELAADALSDVGYDSTIHSIAPIAASWAPGLSRPTFPVLIATRN